MEEIPPRKTLRIYLDVDGTLIDHNDVFRPHLVTCLSELHSQGHTLYMWSAGGEEYAREWKARILNTTSKMISIRVIPKNFLMVERDKYAFVVDDLQYVIDFFKAENASGMKVPEYDSNLMKSDSALLDLVEVVEHRVKEISENR